MTGLEKGVTAFLAGLITVAIWATLVNPKAQTPAVLNAAGGAISGSLASAEGNSNG